MIKNDKIDDGGPAFPQLDVTAFERDGHGDLIDPFTSAHGGMTLRDWFAGKFLAGASAGLAGGAPLDADPSDQSDVDRALRDHWSLVARAAYIAADSMIAARKGGAA